MTVPEPRPQRFRAHLGRFMAEPLALMEEGAAAGPLFRVRLWRPALVGYRPSWNRLVMKDLDTFRSSGSLGAMTPYLNGGVVVTDAPHHRGRRQALNPAFSRQSLAGLADAVARAVDDVLPCGPFEALSWSSVAVRRLLSVAFFGEQFPPRLLSAFLRPLQKRMPAPLLPRPRMFRQMNRALATAVADAPDGSIAAALRDVEGSVDEIRVALAAGYDTTAHTMAWALWHLADRPVGLGQDELRRHLDETLRLYPAGWVGSRIATKPVEHEGVSIRPGDLVLVSPYLTHRDPELWDDPLRFRPSRFTEALPPWGYLPFLAGERTCLGSHLARLLLTSTLTAFNRAPVRRDGGDPRPHVTLTLAPRGPLLLRRG